MPIYEYACDDCQKKFEVFVGVRDGAVQECQYCAGKNIRKLISNCSFQLKGSGWYVTDYARKDSTSSNGANGKKTAADDQPAAATPDSPSGSSETAAAGKDSSSPASSEKAA